MTIHDTPRSPRAGDYASLDEPGGWRVLCNRRFPGDRYCPEVLALVEEAVVYGGMPGRVLHFTCDAWIQRSGVWRLGTSAKKRRKAGLVPRTQTAVGPYRVTADGTEEYVGGHHVPALPAFFHCPACRHERLLDDALLDAVGFEQCTAWAERLLAERHLPP